MKRNKKRFSGILAMLLAVVMMCGTLPTSILASGSNGNSVQTMEITEEALKANGYATYYYSKDIVYTYQGEHVSFKDENTIQAGNSEYKLRNKQTEVAVDVQADGTAAIGLTELSIPVGQIAGAWNVYFGGKVQMVYQTDIPGMEEVCSEASTNAPTVITLTEVPEGTWHLTGGTIYEEANPWSPGYDFGNGTVKAACFGTLPDVVFTIGKNAGTEEEEERYLGVKTEAKVYEDFQNDLWLQYQHRQMQVGDTAVMYPWRVEQVVSNAITNDVQRPDFHFEIISGDSIELDTTVTNTSVKVTAVKPGTSVVKVTYDAVTHKGKTWGTISDVNTGYVVYTVGETGNAVIKTNEEFANWRLYDTIYYSEGETVPYTFTVETENAADVAVTVNGIKIAGDNNQYTANLENRSNIIGIVATDAAGNTTSMYRVIDARFMEVIVANKTHANEVLRAGDTANISFKGITMPVYKLATIYNPQMGKNAAKVTYENDSLGKFAGQCRQWDLATNNDFDVTFAEKGDYTFHSEDGIYCAWWGSKLGTEATMNGSGEPNLNAPTMEGKFSVLPDFTVKVAGSEEEEQKPVDPIPEGGYLGVKTEAKVYEDFENDLWLQYQHREMQVGDSADLYPRRVEQILSDSINNDVQRPVFHFEIISGDSVALNTTETGTSVKVTAIKPGTSVVKVTYDAVTYKGKTWGAISDVNTGYVVYTVGETGNAVIKTNEAFANWRLYDTIYYSEGETVPYTFTVETENEADVVVTVNGIEIEGDNDQYTANLENRSNIIGIVATDAAGNRKSMYRVIDARFMEVVVVNKTHPNEVLKAGDTANISFRGITMPVYKLATIYNPQFGRNATRVIYENKELGQFEGKCSQWDLAANNDFDVTFAESGDFNFHSENGILCTWWGSELGTEMTMNGGGLPNLAADSWQEYFGVLPDFTVKVASADSETGKDDEKNPDTPNNGGENQDGKGDQDQTSGNGSENQGSQNNQDQTSGNSGSNQNNGSAGDAENSTAPKTGDTSAAALWIVLAVAVLGCVVGIIAWKYKKKREK